MTENSLLENILDRLGSSSAEAELFGADEADDWPPGALDLFVKNKLLRRAQPSQVIECRGCEEYCDMPVNIYPAENNRPARAFIVCDKSQNVGRVRVEFARLEQWQTTVELIAAALVQLLGFSEPAKTDGKHWNIGVLKGNATNKSLVVLLAKDCLSGFEYIALVDVFDGLRHYGRGNAGDGQLAERQIKIALERPRRLGEMRGAPFLLLHGEPFLRDGLKGIVGVGCVHRPADPAMRHRVFAFQ